MENILKKALREVLTPRYSEELRNAYDTGYKPTEKFENEMRELVRRTDRPPIYRYTRYIAAAAAVVVIAVGAAVLAPVLMNRDIGIVGPEVTSETSVPPVTVTADTSADNTSFTTSGNGLEAITVSSSDTEDTTFQPPESSEPVSDTSLTETSPSAADAGSQTSDTAGGDNVTVVDDDDDDDNPGQGAAVDDDEPNEDDIMVDDSDDDISVDNDVDHVDAEDDVIWEGDDDAAPVIPAKVIEIENGQTLGDVFAKEFGETSFDVFYAHSGNYTDPQKNNNIRFDISERSYDFLQDFIHNKLPNAKAGDDTDAEATESITLNIRNVKPVTRDPLSKYYNYSAWTHYSDFFGRVDEGEEDVIDDDDDQPDIEDESVRSINFRITIWRDKCRIDLHSLYVAGSENEYIINKRFYLDKADIEELFGSVLETLLPENMKTVGDITSAMDITSGNISTAYANVHGIYDTEISYGRIGTDYITGMLKKYSGKKLTPISGGMSGTCADIELFTKNDAKISLLIYPDNRVVITDRVTWYEFGADAGELDAALKAVSAANGITIPLYKTLGEYLSDKNFTEITRLDYSDGKGTLYGLEDAEELKAFMKLLKSEFKTAEYTFDPSETHGSFAVNIYVSGYSRPISLFTQDSENLMIRTTHNNWFRLSDGFSQTFLKLLMENKKTIKVTEEFEEYIDDTDDDQDDEVTPIEEFGDENPIT